MSRQGRSKALKWPLVQAKKELKVEHLLGDDIFKVQGVLTPVEAGRFVDAAEQSGRFVHQGSRGAAHGEAFRDNERLAVMDEQLARQLWTAGGLAAAFAGMEGDMGWRAVGLNHNIRVYRYGVGQRFGKHVDDSTDLPDGHVTRFTVLLYLSGGPQAAQQVEGGETMFWGGSAKRPRLVASVGPQAGLALLHRHGEACLEHEGAAVRSGVKYVLRSDVCFARTQ